MSRPAGVGLLALALCLLGGAFALSSLYVAGVAIALLGLVAWAGTRLAAAGTSVRLELSATAVEEGSRARGTVRLRGWGRALGTAELRAVPGEPWRRMRPRERSVALEVRPLRRGEHLVGPAAVRFRDPLGIAARTGASRPSPLLVLPRVERVRRHELERLAAIARPLAQREEGIGVDGLRPYRVGAPASRIHWLTVARTGVLVERRAEQEGRGAPMLIVLDASAPAGEEELDMAVRAAASLCVGLARLGGCSLLLPGSSAPAAVRRDLGNWQRLHERLALVRAGQPPDWRAAGPARLAIWVGARRADEHGRALASAGCAVSPLPARRETLFEVAGCHVQPLGGLKRGAA